MLSAWPRGRVEGHVRPAQGRGFAVPQAGAEGEEEQVAEAATFGGGDEERELGGGEDLYGSFSVPCGAHEAGWVLAAQTRVVQGVAEQVLGAVRGVSAVLLRDVGMPARDGGDAEVLGGEAFPAEGRGDVALLVVPVVAEGALERAGRHGTQSRLSGRQLGVP